MSFALLHSTLGWALATLAALALRHRAADARCWAWRLGLLKGPLALMLAVPVVMASPLPPRGEGPGVRGSAIVGPPPLPVAPAPAVSGRTYRIDPAPRSLEGSAILAEYVSKRAEPAPLPRLPLAYSMGVAVVLLIRLLQARRPPLAMPRVVGVFRPRVVLPEGLDPQGSALALAHEAAHVRRHDPQWSFVADLVCAALWFAPPVWVCAWAMRRESEAACDAAALRETGASRAAYARLLLAFAGPAPANALGGPARRLARRILMLDRPTKPLGRPFSIALAVLALAALLPWRAVAAPVPESPERGPLHGWGLGVQATRIPLKTATSLMLEEPGVRAKVGWTTAQDAQSKGAIARWQAVMNVYRAEMGQRQKQRPLHDFFAWDAKARPEAFARADKEAGWPVQTPEQRGVLQSLALARFGSAVWTDPEVARRLHLTPDQIVAVTREDAALSWSFRRMAGDMRGELLRPTPTMPPAVTAKVRETNAALLAAPPDKRQPYYLKLANLQRPYQPVFRNQNPGGYRARQNRAVARSWAARADADRRLAALLTEAQRRTLDDLKTDPAAWSRPYVYFDRGSGLTLQEGVRLGADKPALRPNKAAIGQTVIARTRYDVWRRLHSGGKPDIYDYSVRVTPSTIARPYERLSHDTIVTPHLRVDGKSLDALPNPKTLGTPIETIANRDGSVTRVFRTSRRQGARTIYEYRVEIVKRGAQNDFNRVQANSISIRTNPPAVHPSQSKRKPSGPQAPTSLSTPNALSRWSGLTIDGPPAGDEPGNVQIGVAHDADGSTWNVYRATQSAPYTYAVEHDDPAVRRPQMLDYRSGKVTARLRRLLVSGLPRTLTVNGATWTIHPPTVPKRLSPYPPSVGPLSHYAPGYGQGTRRYAEERRRLAATLPSIKRVPWIDEAIRRSLHLNDGETLEFKADLDRPGTEIATVADKEGRVAGYRVSRRRTEDGTFAYEVKSFVRREP